MLIIHQFQSREEQFAKDIKQQRELWQATEKLKRDKWIQEKTKQIKDQTVKGLEPEIQRMLGVCKLLTAATQNCFTSIGRNATSRIR